MDQWPQNYNPTSNVWLSTIIAAVPVAVLFYLLAVKKMLAHRAAIYGFAISVVIAGLVFRMPWTMVGGAVASGLLFGVVRIAWTLLAAVFVYELTVETGHFDCIKESIGGLTPDRRLQVLLIALAFGAVLEGSGGGGAPVAVAGAMMVGLGFNPFGAAVLYFVQDGKRRFARLPSGAKLEEIAHKSVLVGFPMLAFGSERLIDTIGLSLLRGRQFSALDVTQTPEGTHAQPLLPRE